jgi:hypothetical protein
MGGATKTGREALFFRRLSFRVNCVGTAMLLSTSLIGFEACRDMHAIHVDRCG